MEKTILETTVALPTGVTATAKAMHLTVKGPKGEVAKEFMLKGVAIKADAKAVTITAGDKRSLNTVESHVKNMAAGALGGYSQKLKMIYAHFPMTIEVKGKDMLIKNFLGEKQPRRVKIIGSTKVEAKGQEVTVSGPSKEDVGQTIANIKTGTKISRRDSRVFQDGLYKVAE
ncbi:MAG TPA: 50S ribosomal protein L6 [Candidatus Micrarchaeota archaeon]|nr:50S ribosomal protein L6 [Candidatus Micrarchaeota archaeon]